jgi:hypothetical protein
MPLSPRVLTLPCKACGQWRVSFLIAEPFGSFGPVHCRNRECEAAHDLIVSPAQRTGWLVIFDRNTLRYPDEHSDEPPHPVIRFKALKRAFAGDADTVDGPIIVAKRKTYFSKSEIRAIWQRTHGRCHLCRRKRWRLNQRARFGWHIDHVLPNVGGTNGTESPDNFRVACARCNLRKGRGYRHGEIRACLTRFMKEWGY